ncbi:MAG: hypothetical protein J0M12_01555 [Deltaproteobacteria bacterium]|nr:hypothetical protein [Deltaproteobacteria bacterium]
MSWNTKYDKIALLAATAAFSMFAGGCASHTVTHTEVKEVVVASSSDVPGVVEYVWEEPMVDVVDVPPGLDPEGHYYRPAHSEVVEIRQGRWNYYKSK